MLTQLFKETGRIFSLLFRQHRLNIFLWLVGIVGLTISVAYVYPMIYENQSDLVGLGITMQNPAMTVLHSHHRIIRLRLLLLERCCYLQRLAWLL